MITRSKSSRCNSFSCAAGFLATFSLACSSVPAAADKIHSGFGYGNRFDEKELKELPPGSFYTEPPNLPHFARTGDVPAIVRISGVGPSGTRYQADQNRPSKP